MYALLLTVSIFLYLSIVGFAIQTLCSQRQRIFQLSLLSPSIGLAAVLLPVFFLSRGGLPVVKYATYLLLTITVLVALILIVKIRTNPFLKLQKSAVILIVGLMLISWPMLKFDFSWVSYANDDMANYSLGAARFLAHGFFDPPNLNNLYDGRDYTQAYWYLYVPAKVRPGSELILAFVSAITGLNMHQVFMPIIISLHLALVAAVGGMVNGVTNNRKAPLIAMSLMAVSPLNSLGSLYQLIGQVGGLALLVSSISLLLQVPHTPRLLQFFASGIPVFLTISGILVWYPELLPFLGLSWFICIAILTWHDKKTALRLLVLAAAVGSLLLVFFRGTIWDVFEFLLFQASSGTKATDVVDVGFPYMLLPSGLPTFWGIFPLGAHPVEPFLSLGIAWAIALTVWFLSKLPQELRRASAPAIVSLVMFTVAVILFFGNADFGLFKLAMFIQPFLIAVVAIRLSTNLSPSGNWRIKSLVVLQMLLCLASQMAAVNRSTGEYLGTVNEIPGASEKEMNSQFAQLLEYSKSFEPSGFFSDTSHLVIAKYQSLYSLGTSVLFPSMQFFQNISGILPSTEKETISFNGLINYFYRDKKLTTEEIRKRWLLIQNEKNTPFNAYTQKNDKNFFSALPINKVENHLIFIHSKLGGHYFWFAAADTERVDKRNTAFFPMESDPLFIGQNFNGMGRHIMLMQLNPTPEARMVMEATSTVMKNFESTLPMPTINGDPKIRLRFVGRGSGRVFSDPVQPVVHGGISYLLIDIGRDGKQFEKKMTGLMRLYGTEILSDTRRITVFARDISVISQKDYQRLRPPTFISKFPEHLTNRNLEYSGIYEDGWISERAFFVLSAQPDARYLLIKGVIPKIADSGFRSNLIVSINNSAVTTHPLSVGEFEIRIPIKKSPERQRIDLTFDEYQVLTGLDGRRTAGKIDFIGFVNEAL